MLRRFILTTVVIAAVCATASGAQRLSFVRTIPAEHELPGERVVILYTMGDSDQVRTFVDVFVDRANRSRAIAVDDATERGNHIIGERASEAEIRRIRREHPADVYLGVNRFTCESVERSGEVSFYNVDGERVKRPQRWADTTCRARIDVFDAAAARHLKSFDVKGEGTSQRVSEVTAEDRKIAAMQAARYAAISASELITPRRVRESVELDESAPGFDEMRGLIDADRLAQARQRWEQMLRENASSAALHYDLAAVCEAIGDLESARTHYESAQRLAPEQPRYRSELSMFRRRNGQKK